MFKIGDVVRLGYDPHIEKKELEDLQHWKIIKIEETYTGKSYILKGLETETVLYADEDDIKKVFRHTRKYMQKKLKAKASV